jgi:hypothetical protein
MSGSNNPFASLITNVADQYGVPQNIALAVSQQESGMGTAGNYLMGVSAGPDAFNSDPNAQATSGMGILARFFNSPSINGQPNAGYNSWPNTLSIYNQGSASSATGQAYARTVLGIANQASIGGVPNPGSSNNLTGGSYGYDPYTGLPTDLYSGPGQGSNSPAGQAATGSNQSVTTGSYLKWLENLLPNFFLRFFVFLVALILFSVGLISLATGKGTDTMIREQARKILP